MEEGETEKITKESFREKLNNFISAAEKLQRSAVGGETEKAWDEFEECWEKMPLFEMAKTVGASDDWVAAMNHDIITPWSAFAVVVWGNEANKTETESLSRHFCRVVKSFANELLGEKKDGEFDVLEVAEDAAVIIRANNKLAEQNGRTDQVINLDIKTKSSWPLFKGKEDDFARVFQNLFTNARKALYKKEGKKEISVVFDQAADGSELIISVADNGSGVKPEQREEIFKRGVSYFKLREDSRTGKGIGLAMVKEAVEEHKGNIKVGENEGGGAKFMISFPLKR